MTFPIRIPWDGGEIWAEHDDGLTVDFDGFKLDSRAQTLVLAVLYYYAAAHRAEYPESGEITFSAGPDLVFCNTLSEDEARACLHDLLAGIRISASLGVTGKAVA
jgi:hypothetical protein